MAMEWVITRIPSYKFYGERGQRGDGWVITRMPSLPESVDSDSDGVEVIWMPSYKFYGTWTAMAMEWVMLDAPSPQILRRAWTAMAMEWVITRMHLPKFYGNVDEKMLVGGVFWMNA
jgi:hypothetical protein